MSNKFEVEGRMVSVILNMVCIQRAPFAAWFIFNICEPFSSLISKNYVTVLLTSKFELLVIIVVFNMLVLPKRKKKYKVLII